MAEPQRPTVVRPFRALHFDTTRVRAADVVAPPYDVVSGGQRADLAGRSPYNVVRLVLPEPGQEDGAAELLRRWRSEGVLTTDPTPSLYRVEQEYTGPDGVRRTREGVLALVRVEPYASRVVRPHERTHAGPKAGRLRLLRAAHAQLSPVFALFRDPSGVVGRTLREGAEAEPLLDVTDDDGTRARMWRVPRGHEPVLEALAAAPLLIADGHHRYETALAYAEERPQDPGAAWTLMYLSSADAPGVTIFPTHRVVGGVDEATAAALPELLRRQGTAVDEVPGDVGALEDALARAEGPAFGVWRGGGRPGLLAVADPAAMRRALPEASSATRTLDVAAVQALALGPVLDLPADAVPHTDRLRYFHRAADAAAAAEAPDAVALILRAPSIAEVEAVADAGEVMPPKSTYFYPKTIDGFVLYDLDEPPV